MKAKERELYDSGYGTMCVQAVLLFGHPPRGPNHNWEGHRQLGDYQKQVRDWWLSTQQPGTSPKRAYKFYAYFAAWSRDQLRRARDEGRL